MSSRSSASNGTQPSRSARSTSAAGAPRSANRRSRSSRMRLTLCFVALGGSCTLGILVAERRARCPDPVVEFGHRTTSLPPMIESDTPVGARSRRVLLLAGGAVAIVLVVIAGASLAEHRLYRNKVLPGVEVDSIDVGGKTELAASDTVARVATELEQTPIRAKARDRMFTAQPGVIGFTVDVDATVKQATDAGRTGNPIAMAGSTIM